MGGDERNQIIESLTLVTGIGDGGSTLSDDCPKEDHRVSLLRGCTCTHMGLSVVPSSAANVVQVLEMADAFEQIGYPTTLHLYTSSTRLSKEALTEEYGLDGLFRLVLHPLPRGKWSRRWADFWVSFRSTRATGFTVARNPIPALGALIAGSPVILELHSVNLGLVDRFALGLLRRSHKVQMVAISERLRSLLERDLRTPPNGIIVEHDAVRGSSTVGSSPVDFDAAGFNVVYIGSVGCGRGIELIAAVASRCAGVEFTIVGGVSGELKGIEMLPNLRVVPRVHHRDVPAVLSCADVLLMPYTSKPEVYGGGVTGDYCSPLKLFEYLSAGRAIIASDLSSTSEVLRNGVNAIVLPEDDVEAWVAAVGRLRDDYDLRLRLGAAAAETAGYHSWTARAERLLQGSWKAYG